VPTGVITAGISGLTTLGGALIGSGSQKRAAKEQGRANQEALRYQREKDAEARRRYDQSWALYQQKLASYEATKRAIAKKHGIELPEWAPQANPMAGPAPSGGRPGLTPGNPLPGAPHYSGQPAPGGVSDLSGMMRQGLAPGGFLTGPKPVDDGSGIVGGSLGPPGGAVPVGPGPQMGGQMPVGPGPAEDASEWSNWSRYARVP
jgi:hypothetical protein